MRARTKFAIALAAAMATAGIVPAQPMSGTNYQITRSVFASGGQSSSTSYNLEGAIAQPAPIGEASSTNYQLVAGFVQRSLEPDTDGDGIPDSNDNCTLVPNADQRDTDGDGYGNICDADLNNDSLVNFGDLAAFKSVFGTSNPDADFNGDGFVNFADLALFKSMFGSPPGP